MNPPMHYVRRGSGEPLLLVHGLGGSHHSWDTVVDALAMQRDLVIVDLPGFSITPPLPGEVSIATLSDAVTTFLADNGLTGIDAVGSSMGARLVLELARRGVVGNVVSRIVIGWGRQDRVCIPTQAARAERAFPTAEMHWFKDSGHFPQVGHSQRDRAGHLASDAVSLRGRALLTTFYAAG